MKTIDQLVTMTELIPFNPSYKKNDDDDDDDDDREKEAML